MITTKHEAQPPPEPPDISGKDSPRLRELVRVTSLEIKAAGGVGAATSLEMIGYIRELERAGDSRVGEDDYVAWCRYTYDSDGSIKTIVTCDSDAKGAFKVYRARPDLHREAPAGAEQQGVDTNWPLSDTLMRLVFWAQHLHDDHNCDCHGWEERSFIIAAAETYAAQIATSPSPDSIRQAAEEIVAYYEVHKDRCHSNERYPSPPCDCGAIEEVVAILQRRLGEAGL